MVANILGITWIAIGVTSIALLCKSVYDYAIYKEQTKDAQMNIYEIVDDTVKSLIKDVLNVQPSERDYLNGKIDALIWAEDIILNYGSYLDINEKGDE